MNQFPFFRQQDIMDCGPSCIKMIAKYYGKNLSIQSLRKLCQINKTGVSLLGISQAAESCGFRTKGLRIHVENLSKLDLPCILHWQYNHFVVLYKVKKDLFHIADSGKGLITYKKEEFLKHWTQSQSVQDHHGIVLTFETTPKFEQSEIEESNSLEFSFISKYLSPHKKMVIQILIGLVVGSLLQLIMPFLAQNIVDVGISVRNLSFVKIIIIGQVIILISRLGIELIRSWILLNISSRVNISILTDFFIKLMKLPMNFFESKQTGDILQRIQDQGRIQSFLTGSTLTFLFSIVNMVIFASVLCWYDFRIFMIFMISSLCYAAWVVLFLKKRRMLDFKKFDLSSKNQSVVVQLINGMQEIKLNSCEQQKRWEWEGVQSSLFKYSVKSLSINQVQQAGTFFINEGKNIIITYLVASAVINGQLSLGTMVAIQYIIGQLNSPVEQLLAFIQQMQEAKISLERLNEIHSLEDEEQLNLGAINHLPQQKSITIKNLTYSYPGAGNKNVLSNIDLIIPEGKTTAIVGASGSGKTTILKILLRIVEQNIGEIKVGNINLKTISYHLWRRICGAVMQDGFIFSDTIANNIYISEENPDIERLIYAIKIANLEDFINSLPLGLNTKIGQDGSGLSQGQKQRILIARAVYKNPEYIFFDEATNALDAYNEKVILNNLTTFFKNKTVVVVAHRLSTVRNADNIIVLNDGEIIEQGTHLELIALKGMYFKLIQNQLELTI